MEDTVRQLFNKDDNIMSTPIQCRIRRLRSALQAFLKLLHFRG